MLLIFLNTLVTFFILLISIYLVSTIAPFPLSYPISRYLFGALSLFSRCKDMVFFVEIVLFNIIVCENRPFS